MPTRTLGLEGSGLEGLTSLGERNEYQQRRWTLKGVDCEITHRLERGMKHFL